ncbi:MAG: DUF4010 domain-containing protein, partial [Sulfuricaulis sp.]|uniref:DUF4010 domain-containing protein n=1 Tax=Sulfuricaulis sp. TaxID=2003553 RepID=UPI003C35421C
FTAMAVAAAGLAGAFYWHGIRRPRPVGASGEVRVKNPFSLAAATRFGLVFALVLLVVKLTERYAPVEGMYVVAAVAGLTDVDAITLSMAEFARQSADLIIAAAAISIAALSNTLVKYGMVVVLGSRPLRQRLSLATAAILAVGLTAIWLM